MLNSLYIKNFLNLEELTIESLGRVNLITGKNNTGKSSVLEAVALWVAPAKLPIINQILINRGENTNPSYSNRDSRTYDDLTGINLKALSSLFTGRVLDFDKKIIIDLKENGKNSNKDGTALELKFVNYIDETRDNNGSRVKERIIISDDDGGGDDDSNNTDIDTGLEIKIGENTNIRPLKKSLRFYRPIQNGSGNFLFVTSRNISEKSNPILFDRIALTDKEIFIIDALKIIEPQTQKIAFVEENGKRKPVIKLDYMPVPVPLQSMGDGINRILNIILALVNCEKGYLLIDEFENGLHHTVQEQLWSVVFYLAEKLDIQVFATTHSWDCIEAYNDVLNDEKKQYDGRLIRLENKNGKIRTVEFAEDEIKSAAKYDIEIR